MTHSQQVLTREKRIKLFKVDCPSDILFSGWKPDGKVYTKTLTMKNVSSQLLTLTYKLPELPCFFTPFPDQIILPIGMEYTITISFQPVAPIEVFSELIFHVNQFNENFKIKLRGELPLLKATTELDVKFPMETGVCEENSFDVALLNDGEIPYLFQFTIPEATQNDDQPFSISPMSGLIHQNEQLKIKYTFKPKLSGQLITKINLRIKKTDIESLAKVDFIDYQIQLTAISKFPYFELKYDDQFVDQLTFLNTTVISQQQKEIFICNQSNVRSYFKICKNNVLDYPYNQIQIIPDEGIIQPNSQAALKVIFKPTFSASFNQTGGNECMNREDYDEISVFVNSDPQEMQFNMTYTINTRSLVQRDFLIFCNSIPVDMQLNTTKIDFGTVKCGSSSQKSIYVKNNSKYDCPFQLTFEGIMDFKGASPNCILQNDAVKVTEMTELVRPVNRRINQFPFSVFPSSGVATSQINTTVTFTCDLTNFTSRASNMLDQESSKKSYIPPQPLSFYVQYKTPGCPIQFVHITATILPEDGIDSRPAPLTMDYAERFENLRRNHTIDGLMGMMVPSIKNNTAAIPANSPLYDERLLEFETEYTNQQHCSEQSLIKFIKDYDIHQIETKPHANTLLPTDSILYEFEGKLGVQNGYPAEISHRAFNFSYVPVGQVKTQLVTIYNNSSTLDMFIAVTGAQKGDGMSIEFVGIGNNSQIESRDELEQTQITTSDGIEYLTCMTRGLVVKVPSQQYGYFQISLAPEKSDEFYFAKYAFLIAHQPLLLYRCFRYAIVGSSFVRELSVCGFSRAPSLPALSSSVPQISLPVISNCFKLPPTAPGSVSRQTFAMTNPGTSTYVVNLSEINNNFIHIYPQVFLLQAKQTVVLSIAVTFPHDAIQNKEKYGFTTSKQSPSTVIFDDILIFNINNSDVTTLSINLTCVCSGLDVRYQKVDEEVPVFAQVGALKDVEVQMAPVSLASESSRLISMINNSLLPIQIHAATTSKKDEQLMFIEPGDAMFSPCQNFNLKYAFKALEKYVCQQNYSFTMQLHASIPRQFCLPVPANMSIYSSQNVQQIEQNRNIVVNMNITKRLVEITPKTINLKNVVPYTPMHVPINIHNASHCNICYTLEVHEILFDMPQLEFEEGNKILRKYKYVKANDTGDYLVPNLYNKLYDPESIMTEMECMRCPQIYIKSGAGGIILPHSSQTIYISVHPFSTKTVRANVYAKIVEMETSNHTYQEVVQQLEDQAIYMQGTSHGYKQYYEHGIDKTRMFECKLEVQSNYPRFFISDISCPKIGSSQLRDILNVDLINEFLAGEATMKERLYNTPGLKREKLLLKMQQNSEMRVEYNYYGDDEEQRSQHSSGRLDIDPATKKSTFAVTGVDSVQKVPKDELLLTEFSLLLGPDNQSPDRSYFVVLTLSNPSEIPCKVSFDLPKGPELGDVPWFQQMPSVQQQRTMSLLARKIYSVSPQEVELEPYGKQCITINYSHIEEGIHELNVLAQIQGGRSFFLHLIGSTLAKFEPALIAPMEQKLLPVVLAEMLPPRQFLKVHNPGNVYVQYQLINPQLIYDNIEQEVEGSLTSQKISVDQILHCLNPIGVLAPDQSSNVVIQFKPNQVGLAHMRYDMQLQKITIEEYNAFRQARKYFDNEGNADLADEDDEPVEIKKLVADNFFECNEVYQQIDIFGYGFVANTKVPVQLLPSYCKNGSPTQPACGAVSLTNIHIDDQNDFISQRGLGYCQLSCGRVVLGAVPTFSQVSTIIEIKALPQNEAGYCEWQIAPLQKTDNISFDIQPRSGTLQFDQIQQISIKITTGSLPAAFLDDIPFLVKFISTEDDYNKRGIVADGYSRLPAVLANTVSSAARVSETAILQQFDPSQLNKAGLDQQTRQAHAMLYGVEDRVSKKKVGPLSLYKYLPTEDILWLTISLHSHRSDSLQFYKDLKFGMAQNETATLLKQKIRGDPRAKVADLNEEDQKMLEDIVVQSMKGAFNKLISDKDQCQTLIKLSQRTKRNALNGLQKANFFQLDQDDLINVVDTQCVVQPEFAVDSNQFVKQLQEIFFDETK